MTVTESGEVTVIALPEKGAPQVTTKKIGQYFSGRYLSMMPLWPTGGESFEVSISQKGDWLGDAARQSGVFDTAEVSVRRKAAPGFRGGQRIFERGGIFLERMTIWR